MSLKYQINSTIKSTIKHRRDTALDWTVNNTILKEGEFGIDLDSGRFKIGDGSTPWINLPYFVNELDLSEIEIPDGYHGASAYEIAVLHGFVGTEEQWLASLTGIVNAEVPVIYSAETKTIALNYEWSDPPDAILLFENSMT